MSTVMNKKTLAEEVAIQARMTKKDATATVELVFDLMAETLKNGGKVDISGFGKFEAYDKNARKGRNPQTDESITLPPRKVVVFRLSRKFRVELNGGEEE